jgi:purine-binding chemotaxis protein CheW
MDTQFCTFYVHQLFFGIDVTKVQEVIRYQEMTRVPLASGVVRGLINLRGQIVTAVDMRHLLKLPTLDPDALPMNVVVRREDGAISLLVDEIGDVIQVPPEAFDRVPDTVRGPSRELIKAVCKLDGRLLMVLDSDCVAGIDAGGDLV